MPTVEERALALVNEVLVEHGGGGRLRFIDRTRFSSQEAVCRALEAHDATLAEFEAFKREVSDSVEHYLDQWRYSIPSREVFACQFGSFILPKPVDPLVEAIREASVSDADDGDADRLRAALAKRGGRIVFKEVGDAD